MTDTALEHGEEVVEGLRGDRLGGVDAQDVEDVVQGNVLGVGGGGRQGARRRGENGKKKKGRESASVNNASPCSS